MKQLFVIPAVLIVVLSLNSGCQKEISPDILKDSTITNLVPVLRQIKVQHPSTTDPLNYVFSLQYDTTNRKINVYLDDTTTTNPFDQLVVNYEFNSAGYLINSNAADANGVMQSDFSIKRDAANHIQQIIEFNAEDNNNILYNDTVFYSYASPGNGTIVQDSVRFQGQSGYSTEIVTYNTQNKPISAGYSFNGIPYGQEIYNYNAQGFLINILTDTDTTDFTYDNTTIAANWQNLPMMFLGKDYYLLQREPLTYRLGYNFLTFIIESAFETTYNPLLTQPLKKITRHGYPLNNPTTLQTKIVNFTNSYNNNLPSSISVLPIGDDPFYYSFKYQ